MQIYFICCQSVITLIWSCGNSNWNFTVCLTVACSDNDARVRMKWDFTQFHFPCKWRICPLFPTACNRVSTLWTCATQGAAHMMWWTATKPRPLLWNQSHYPAAPTSQSSTKYPPCIHRYFTLRMYYGQTRVKLIRKTVYLTSVITKC